MPAYSTRIQDVRLADRVLHGRALQDPRPFSGPDGAAGRLLRYRRLP